MKDSDRIGAMRAFARVGAGRSFVGAARELGLSAGAVSRRVAQLENHLGCRLLQRTTRRVSLTEAGSLYLRECEELLARLDQADAALADYADSPRGTLRIALPNLYGQRRVAPLLPKFMTLYPELQLQLTFDDRFVDLVASRIDAAVRIGDLQDGDYRGRRLVPNRRYLCATPGYLERAGIPTAIEDLRQHACLHFAPLLNGPVWQFRKESETAEVRIDPVLQSDNAEALRLAALGGQGIALLADFVIEDDLAAKRLLPILSDWTVAESWVWVVFPHAPMVPKKTRVLIDFLVAELAIPA